MSLDAASPPARAVAVTGIGVVAPGGVGRDAFWRLLSTGTTATRRISLFDASDFRSRIAAECDFDPYFHGLDHQDVSTMDRYIQFGVVAAREAWLDAGLSYQGLDRTRLGISMGSAVGGTTRLEDQYAVVSEGGRRWLVDHRRVERNAYEALIPSSLASELAARFGAEGPATVVSTGCTSGLDAVGHAAAVIADGEADLVIAGASDSPISPISVACFDAIRATSARNDDPAHASRPFDRDRDGFVIGEGCAVLVLESLERALTRGARIYCQVGGFATRSNAYHMTGLKADGADMAEAIRLALEAAAVRPDQVDYVNAHGSGTRQNDRHETAAVKAVLGDHAYETPMSSIKSMVGHSLGAIGSIELAACALAIKHDLVPPTANLDNADPECDLDYVAHEARAQRTNTVLSVGSGFGGFQSAVVLTAPPEVAA
jgi:beta-ketoacyl-acyl-carrier-protein synthase II